MVSPQDKTHGRAHAGIVHAVDHGGRAVASAHVRRAVEADDAGHPVILHALVPGVPAAEAEADGEDFAAATSWPISGTLVWAT